MNPQYTALLNGVEYSPLLSDTQKWVLIEQIEQGEPYSEELLQAIVEFLRTTTVLEDIAQDILQERLKEIDGTLEGKPENKAEIRKRASQIVSLVNNFMEEMKKMEKEYDEKVEAIITQQGDKSEIDDIHDFLNEEPPQAT